MPGKTPAKSPSKSDVSAADIEKKDSPTSKGKKKGKSESNKKEGKKNGIGKVIVIFFLFLIILLGAFIALIKFDVASLGTKVIGPYLIDIPVINLILPEMPVEVSTEETGVVQYETLEQAVEILKVTENLLKEKEKEAETLIEQINQLESENERLKVFETNFLDFEKEKEAFDAYIVAETDSSTFLSWYETMNPDNAARIYGELIVEKVASDELNDLVLTYQEMKPDAAAAILGEMSTTRLEMVATIIKHLDADQAAKILGAMDTETASRITAYLYPEN